LLERHCQLLIRAIAASTPFSLESSSSEPLLDCGTRKVNRTGHGSWPAPRSDLTLNCDASGIQESEGTDDGASLPNS
jgi:hypothetical protein